MHEMKNMWRYLGRALNAMDRADVMVRAERMFSFDGEVIREMGTSGVLKSTVPICSTICSNKN